MPKLERDPMRLWLVEGAKKLSGRVARALRTESYAVDVAEHGPAGWSLVETYAYELIILDLMLPGLSGAELLKRIRRNNHTVPFLILTARDFNTTNLKPTIGVRLKC